MKLKLIACEVLARPVYLCASRSPHIIDIDLIKKGLHERPAELRAHLQSRVDSAEDQAYDYILLGYGLCGQATAGLVARTVPLVIPRAHDCITLFLGSRLLYQHQFDNHPGTYWYAQDYIERSDGSTSVLSLGSGTDNLLQATYEEYVQKYGKDNADYLMEVMGAWQQHYQRAVYIDMGVGDGTLVQQQAQEGAARRGWTFERLTGDLVLIRRLLEGDWQAGDDFLTIPPGHAIQMTYDESILACLPQP